MLGRTTAKSEQKSWTELAAYAAALSESAALRAKGDGKGAVQRLASVKPLPGYRDQTPLVIARAAALDAAGDGPAVYDALAAAAAKTPSDALLGALAGIGRALGRRPRRLTPISGGGARPQRSRRWRSLCPTIRIAGTCPSRTIAAGSCS